MTDTTTEQTILWIPEVNMPEVLKRIAALQKRAARAKSGTVTMKVAGEEVRMIHAKFGQQDLADRRIPHECADERGVKIPVYAPAPRPRCIFEVPMKYFHIEVTGEAPKVAGYAFLGTLEHGEDAQTGEPVTVVRTFPGQQVPVEMHERTADNCDHCRKVRTRKDTYLVRHDDGRILQVGKSCLRDFLGIDNPEALVRQLEFLRRLHTAVGGGMSKWVVSTFPEFVAYVALEVRKAKGRFITRAQAQGGGATADDAWSTMFPTDSRWQEAKATKEEMYPAEQDIELAARIAGWARTFNPQSDFERNLSAVARKDAIEPRDIGIAAAAYPAYTRAQAGPKPAPVSAVVPAASRPSAHLGKYAETITLAVVLVSVRQWNNRRIHEFRTQDGDVVVVWSKDEQPLPVDVGQAVVIDGNVRNHTEFRGVKQTELAAVKVRVGEGVGA